MTINHDDNDEQQWQTATTTTIWTTMIGRVKCYGAAINNNKDGTVMTRRWFETKLELRWSIMMTRTNSSGKLQQQQPYEPQWSVGWNAMVNCHFSCSSLLFLILSLEYRIAWAEEDDSDKNNWWQSTMRTTNWQWQWSELASNGKWHCVFFDHFCSHISLFVYHYSLQQAMLQP